LTQFLSAAVQGVLDPGDHIGAELALGIDGAGGSDNFAGDAAEQIGHHRGGADVDGQDVWVSAVGGGVDRQTAGEDLGGIGPGGMYGHVPVDDGLAGQHLLALQGNDALSAGAFAAAGGIGTESGCDLGLENRSAGRNREGNALRQEGNGMGLHKSTSGKWSTGADVAIGPQVFVQRLN
jgi:hypothetical protein